MLFNIMWWICLPGCPVDWVNYKGNCYFFSKNMQNFDEAKTSCESTSASLLIINDREELVTND